jgi:PAS domain S-box-containing protein
VPMDKPNLMNAVVRGDLDFVVVDPVLLVQLGSRYKVEAIATAEGIFKKQLCSQLGGTVICLEKRQDLSDLRQLAGQTIAAGKDETLGNWYSILREFASIRFDLEEKCPDIKRFDTPQGVVEAVATEKASVGFLRAGALESLASQGRAHLKDFQILTFPQTPMGETGFPFRLSTRLYPEWVFAAGPETPEDTVRQVAAGLLRMPIPKGPSAAEQPYTWTIPASDQAVHDCLKELSVYPYKNYQQFFSVGFFEKPLFWIITTSVLGVLFILALVAAIILNGMVSTQKTGREKAQFWLQENIERFQHIISCSKDWIWETDMEGRYIYSSPMVKEMLGYEVPEIIGKNMYDLLSTSEKAAGLDKKAMLAAPQGSAIRKQLRLLTKNNRVVVHESMVVPRLDSKGKIIGYRGMNRDVTAQVRYVKL